MSRAGRVWSRIRQTATAIVVAPTTWAIGKLVKFGDWLERKQATRAARKSDPP